jgi:hypothetical protein
VGVKELEPDRLALLDLLPDLLVEEISHCIASRLDKGNSATDSHASGQEVTDRKSNGKVHGGKGKGLGHIITPFIDNRCDREMIAILIN